ncbi:MAG: GreA/GreB family elongation factor [Verrucomicrobiaceae bacterium]|nr:GreA/GreB family elongation factor [Verrucomicrobiaceae bacterium]MDB6116340.1 GreA/GreB family elongation factor [Verrucomicrobiaceae bacterium]
MNSELQKLVTAGKITQVEGNKLDKLEPGTACLHKSWGVGRIAEWDLLGDRVLIDFEGKPGHPMKLSFAADSLTALAPDHILARRVTDLPTLQALAKDKPAELVELALKSSGGSMSLDDLERIIAPRIVGTAEYKKWWDNAKKELKAFRHIVVPAKRTEKLTLRSTAEKPGQVMVNAFLNVRDLKSKLAAMAAIVKDLDLFENAATELLPVFKDLSDTVRKTWKLQLKESLHLLLQRDELVAQLKAEIPADAAQVYELVRDGRTSLTETVNSLPVGMLGRLYSAFPIAFPDGTWVKECLAHLTRTGGRAVSEITTVMDANDELDVLAEFLSKAVRNRTLSTDLLIWICKERKGLSEAVFSIDLGNAIIGALEDDHVSGGPKKTGRLHDTMADDRTLVGEMVADADMADLKLFAKRILSTSVFDELTRRSLMGKIIKARPEMEAMMEENATAVKDEALIVSWESLQRKKAELDDIANIQIPHNKNEIQIARAEGDLRENGGYKAAREQQTVLLRMKGKYESELRHAQGTDFAGAKTDRAGIGTIVDVVDEKTGKTETFTILGAWDSDPDKNHLSYMSEAAKALIGKSPGDEVELSLDGTNVQKVKLTGIKAYKA